ncbi:hypothetical protein C7C46_06545 [Streptomyces tateyamensis]|uniref:Uncharacterized protein n=1 Tax=Streptomyces tateyamensis TaxID=565073 RepID=A0A2V4NV55_9ACTN|nr:hypothetical protein C7C46_06545 [Streptomyces tateyamensis]
MQTPVPAAPAPAAPASATAAAAPQERPGRLIAPAAPGAGRTPTLADFPGWSEVRIEFPPDDTLVPEEPAAKAIPDQRAGEADAVEEPAEEAGGVGRGSRGLLAGRRPSPLLLLASGVLVGGAVTGLILVLLAGWGLAYLSARLGDLTKKFVVFGIPLITMSGSSLWFWGRSEGRWGQPLAKGATSHAVFAAAPGVLRLAGVLSALLLLAIAMRRRKVA